MSALRPDDVWQAILAQFSLYVQANENELRDTFVSHEGKKEYVGGFVTTFPMCDLVQKLTLRDIRLEIESVGTLETADFAAMAQDMGRLLEQNVKDPELRKWLVPGTLLG